jgi:branched-chain amino acid transport system permease protein
VTAQLVENIAQALAAGLFVGAIYGLMCVGLALIFGVMRVINFAHGDFMMLGMYAAFYFVGAFGVQAALGTTLGPYVAALVAGPVVFVAGYLVHLALMSRVSGTRAQVEAEGHFAQLILTLGVSLVLQNGGLIVFGSVLAGIPTPLSSSAWEIGPMWGDLVSVFVNKSRGISAVISALAIIVLALVIGRTAWASRCEPPPTTPRRRPTWASTSTGPTASPLRWA